MSKITWKEHKLRLKSTFRTAHGACDMRKVVLLNIDGALGEATPVEYYGESIDTVKVFLERVKYFLEKDSPDNLLGEKLDAMMPLNYSAKAAVDMAIHDMICKKLKVSLCEYFGLNWRDDIPTSYTISISDPDTIKKQIENSQGYKVYKVKVGIANDIDMVKAVREATDAKIRIDANEGWTVKEATLKIKELEKLDVELVEQPLRRDDFEGFKALRSKTNIPIVVDEGVFHCADITKYIGLADGVNIKLAKAGGLREAFKMISFAKENGMKVMIGCMIGTSISITAAAHLSPLADWVDLDGHFLIENDPYKGMIVENGLVKLPSGTGLGIVKR